MTDRQDNLLLKETLASVGSRRSFFGAGARLMAGSWVLGAAPFAALARPVPSPAGMLLVPGDASAPSALSGRAKTWNPLGRALDRFHRNVDRFACERRVRALAPAFEQLRSGLRAGGDGIDKMLSPRFRARLLAPQRQVVLRQDAALQVSRWLWDQPRNGAEPDQTQALAEATAFCADLRRLLSAHSPLTLADLECLSIIESPTGGPPEPAHLRCRMRFELAGPASGEASPAGATFNRWQAVGEWEIAWEEVGGGDAAGSGPAEGPAAASSGAAAWRISTWSPVEAVATLGPERVFTDVTASAFGQDPSYRTHLLRDTNYWRTVLDTASGIDIFGNCGVSVGDADGDGQDEIYLCQPQGLPNRLYRQRAPGVFEDVSAEAGVDLLDATSMALFADVLNRGRQDLVLITESSPVLFLNDGRGKFKLARDAFPKAAAQAALTGAAMADYDRDGNLDLYVCSYGYFQGQGAAPIPTPYYDARNGPPNHLYRNRGDGTFEDATGSTGLNHDNDRFSFACAWHDIDDDGWPDLVVVNDFGRNNLYRNRGDGTFEDLSETLQGHGSGMSVSLADLDSEDSAELYVGNMWNPTGIRVTAEPDFPASERDRARQFALGNSLYRRDRDPKSGSPYKQVPGADGASRGRWAWCSDVFDLENDGYADLYVVNGFLSSASHAEKPVDAYLWQEVVASSPQSSEASGEYRAAWSAIFELAHQDHPWDGNQRNVFFLNLGDGNFADASAVTGLDFRDDGRSFAVFDYDGDGDNDLIIHSRTGPQLRLMRNDVGQGERALAVRLTATRGNRDAIGARVEIETPARRIVRWLGCGSGFLAQHSKELMFGLGSDASPSSELTARLRWPSGRVDTFSGLTPGYRYYLVEGQASPRREAFHRNSTTPSTSKDAGVSAEPAPGRFSTWLIDPLPLPPLSALGLPDRAKASGPPDARRTLIWLWDASNSAESAAGLETFLVVQNRLRSRLIVWSGEPPASLAPQLAAPMVIADDRLRTFFSTALTYLFDRRRPPAMPTGLLVEEGAAASSAHVVRVYWGGAGAEEIVRDAGAPAPTGAAALPFPGPAHLCSFTRDTRVLGAALAFAGLYAEAEPYLERAVNANHNDADAAYNLALAARELNKPDLALSSVRTALAARPHFPEAENLLGVLLMQSGHNSEAHTHLEKATSTAPDFAEAWNNLGYLRLQQGDLNASRTAVEKALALAPDFPEALNNLGIIAARQGKPEEAGGLFRKALAVDPENEQAGNNLGVLEARQGHTAEAIETFKGVLAHNPEAASVLLNLARLDLSTGRPAEALHLLEPWAARHPDDAAARQLIERAKAGNPESH